MTCRGTSNSTAPSSTTRSSSTTTHSTTTPSSSTRPSNSTTPSSSTKPASSTTSPSKTGAYGIVETSDSRNRTEAGVLEPIRVSYNPSLSFSQHALAIGQNMSACDLINYGFVKSGGGSNAYIRFVQEDGKFGLRINAWRKSKSDNDSAGILNGALSAMVYLSNNKSCGEALWSWVDTFNINNGHVDTSSYGFVDDAGGTANEWTATYSNGTKVTFKLDNSGMTLLFNPRV
jgi:hypothetical protein